MKHIKLILFFAFLFLLASCFKQPKVLEIQSIKFLGEKDGNIETEAVALIENPNSFKIEASNIKMQFFIKNEKAGSGSIDKTIVINKKSKASVKMRSSVNTEIIIKTLPQIMAADSFPVDIIIEAKFTSIKLPIKSKFTEYVKTNEIINALFSAKIFSENIKIKNIELIKPSIDKSELKFILEFNNPIPVDCYIKKIDLSVYDSKKKANLLGNTINNKGFKIKSKSKSEISFTVETKNINMAKSLFSKIIKRSNIFFISGEFDIIYAEKLYNIPINKEIEIKSPIF